jgi:ubiquinone/menaquinone biosynthesis C-methylase UbiE
MSPDLPALLPVSRTRAQAKANYDRLSRFYDLLTGGFEQKVSRTALERLHITEGESVLEIGFGTGHGLKQMAQAVGQAGRVYGIDISCGMLAASRRRLKRAGLEGRVELICEDALKMPYAQDQFDAVFLSFTLELFDTPEIPLLLAGIRRVLKPNGRLGVVSMSKEDRASPLMRLYELLHQKFPRVVDCRPIHVERSIQEAGFAGLYRERVSLWGLAVEICIGRKPDGNSLQAS